MKIVRVEVTGPTSRDVRVVLENGDWLEGVAAARFDADGGQQRLLVHLDVLVMPIAQPAKEY